MLVYFLIIIQQLIAGGTHIVAKELTATYPPGLILLLRSFFAALIFAVWLIFKIKYIRKIRMKDIFYLLLLGALNIPANQFLFLQSIKLTSPSNVALAYSLSPVFVMLIAKFFLKEKITRIKVIGIAIAFIGVVIIMLNSGLGFSAGSILGDFLALTASVSWAIYTVVGKKYSSKYGPVITTAFSMIFGFILYLPIFFSLDIPITLSTIDTMSWMKILYLSVFASVVAYAIWYYALSKKEASKVSIFNNIQPIITAVLAAVFLDIAITPLYVVGGILILGGVITTQRA
ncbi:MAG: DMT family transporter [bacterium]